MNTALEIIGGAAAVPEFSPEAVRGLMQRLDLNEKSFALIMNVSPITVRLWTAGAARPCGLSRRLMQLFDVCPEVVGKMSGEEVAI